MVLNVYSLTWVQFINPGVDIRRRLIYIKDHTDQPDYAPAHMNLGVVYKEIGSLDQAITSILNQ